jgi:hypothetical protein
MNRYKKFCDKILPVVFLLSFTLNVYLLNNSKLSGENLEFIKSAIGLIIDHSYNYCNQGVPLDEFKRVTLKAFDDFIVPELD